MCRNSNMAKEGDYKKGKEVIRTIMWSPPRSLSTTVERSLIENKDIHVLHADPRRPYDRKLAELRRGLRCRACVLA